MIPVCLPVHLLGIIGASQGRCWALWRKRSLYSTELTYLPWKKGEVFCEKPVRGGSVIPQEGDWGNSCLLSLPEPVSQGSLSREMMLKFMDQLQIAHVCLTYEVSTDMFPRAFKINISSLRKLYNKGKTRIVCCLVLGSMYLLPP